MKIGRTSLLGKTNTYIKTSAMAILISLSGCEKKAPLVKKDLVEFAQPTAARLIESLENGARHSKIIFLNKSDTPKRIIPQKEMTGFKSVHDTLLEKLKTLPDTMELYYQVYKGKADQMIQKVCNQKDNLLTVGHGNTGRDYIEIAGNKKVFEGDFISQYCADSLFNAAINQKDSILKSNLSKEAFKKLKRHEKDAVLSYLYNVNESLLIKRNPDRKLPESFFDCLENYANGDIESLGKVQAKFNVRPSAKEAQIGIAKRNLVQLIVFGNGEIVENTHSLENLYNQIDILKQKGTHHMLLKEIYRIAEEYGVDAQNLEKTKQKIKKYLYH